MQVVTTFTNFTWGLRVPIGIVIADDHWIFRNGLRFLLENEGFTVLGEASNGHEAVKLTEKFRPDVVVMDFSMPQLNGLDAAKEIRRVSPRTKVILLTAHQEQQYVLEALGVGIKGYLLKSEGAAMVGEAIQEVTRGNAYLSPGIARFAVDSFVGKCADGPV